jgi:hypothetical protein
MTLRASDYPNHKHEQKERKKRSKKTKIALPDAAPICQHIKRAEYSPTLASTLTSVTSLQHTTTVRRIYASITGM